MHLENKRDNKKMSTTSTYFIINMFTNIDSDGIFRQLTSIVFSFIFFYYYDCREISEFLRTTVNDLYDVGHSNHQISEIYDIPTSSVVRIGHRYQEFFLNLPKGKIVNCCNIPTG